jgi:hypothetical protein
MMHTQLKALVTRSFTFTLALLVGTVFTACNNGGISGGGGNPDPDLGVPDTGGWIAPDMGYTPDPNACSGCEEQKIGINGSPFDPHNQDSEFVNTDKDGALVIDRGSSNVNRYLWVADTNLPGVAKIDTETMKIVARYRTGGGSPSRTTVNSLGEAFVGARKAAADGSTKVGVTKILPHGLKCPDSNNDGKVTTSTGPDHVLPYGQDECVVWHTETAGDIRGLAAQDIPGKRAEDICKDFDPQKEFDPTKLQTTPDEHYVWVGGIHAQLYKLDAKTGKILIQTKAPLGIYGAALAGDGKLWIGAGGGAFGFVDLTKCKDQASCDAATTCTQVCNTANCPATCDNATKAIYTGGLKGYGITVDHKQRVWRSGYPTAGVFRYDPNAPANFRYKQSSAPAYGGGIAADAKGFVWAANISGSTIRIDQDTLAHVSIAGATSKGIALDARGRVFAVEYAGKVHLIEPGATINDHTVTASAVTLKGVAYAYSDMTGVQTRLAANEPGFYRTTFSPCPPSKTTDWQFLKYDVEVPPKTWVMFSVRTADTEEALKTAPWATMACIGPPGGQGQVSIKALNGRYTETEVRFVAEGDLNDPTSVKSARIKSFGMLYRCIAVD